MPDYESQWHLSSFRQMPFLLTPHMTPSIMEVERSYVTMGKATVQAEKIIT